MSFIILLFLVCNDFKAIAGSAEEITADVTVTTEALPAGNIAQALGNQVVYILRMDVANSDVALNIFSMVTDGTYDNNDVDAFTLRRNTIPSISGSINMGDDLTMNGTGETVTMNSLGNFIFSPGTHYLLLTVFTEQDATDNNTIHMNGALNPASLTFNDANLTSNQSNNAGVQTIEAPDVALFTYPLPASNIAQGTFNNATYILQVNVSTMSTRISNLSMTTSGTYDADDISSIRVARNNVPTLTGSINLGSDVTITGSGETFSINFSTQTLTIGTHYLIIAVAVNNAATDNNTIHCNGLSNPANLTFTGVPNLINAQSDDAGLATIQAGDILLTTEPLASGSIFQGSFSNISYVLKMEVSVASISLNNFQMISGGTYDNNDITAVTLRRNTIPSITGSTSLGSDATISGAGETFAFSTSSTFAVGTHYLLITVNVSNSGTDENNIHFDGILNPALLGFSTSPNIINNQSNNAGTLTIQAGEITLSTESVLPGSLFQGSFSNITYILKMEVSVASINLVNFQIVTGGTYDNDDLTAMNVRRNTIPSITGSTFLGSDALLTGSGENISISTSSTFNPGIHYLIATVTVHSSATDENTIHLDGILNPAMLSFTTSPIITNNQLNNAGIQTIQAAEITLSTENIPSGTVFQSASNIIPYILRMEVSGGSVTMNNFQMITSGTYDNTDLLVITLRRNTIPSNTGSTGLASDGILTGSGENISFATSSTFAPGTHYLLLNVSTTNNATDENTFHFNGGLNPAVLGFSTSPIITNNQSNNAGIQTIQAGEVTIITEPVAPGDIFQGSANGICYIMRMDVSVSNVNLANVQMTTSGNYDNNDFTSVTVRRNSIPSITGSAPLGSDITITGNGENLSISAPNNFAPGTHYLLVTTNVSPSGTDENTIHLDGLLNPAVLTFSTTPFITSNQSNLAGIKTIQAADVTLSTVSVPAKNILQGSSDNVCYLLKMEVATTNVVINNIQFMTNGTYDNDDILLANLRRHGFPVFSGSTFVSSDNTLTGSGETIQFGSPFNYTPGTYYFFVSLNLSATATNGNTIHFNGALNPAVITFSTSPNITNNQSNLAGLQRIGNAYYQDADNDGYGNVDAVTYATNPPEGYVDDYSDCNDGNNAIYPDAEEVCDGEDNDCDGLTDEDDDSLTGPYWYADVDEDGFGDPNDFVIACNQPDGYVPDSSDECPEDPNLQLAGLCGCGIEETDGDDDGTPDCIDECPEDPNKNNAGYCGCGNPETDTDEDGIPDCADACPDDPNKYWDEGQCGCGFEDMDTDEDGTADCNDECPEDPNYTEAGACGCGVEETDTDDDGTPDCIDNCPDDPNKTEEGACGCGAEETDTDDDGTPDCIDTEECDGSDNDGDGLIDDEDDSVTGQTTWYEDADDDGFGNAESIITSCDQPAGYVDNDGDCRDSEPSINPDALEACNDADDDCDGLVDDDDPDIVGQLEWYQDNDGDGFGNPDVIDQACNQPQGYVGLAGDCDDADADINPDADEICNGVDDDCNDRVDESPECLENDEDGDGIPDEEDNCKLTTNPDQADSDCDSVGDACDVCPGGDDSVDNNFDGRPDCKFPPPYAQIVDDWKCGNKKVLICHINNNGLQYAQTTCINYNALIPHMNHGDYLGPCGNASCPTSYVSGDMTMDATSSHMPGQVEPTQEMMEEIETTLNLELFVDPNPAYEEISVLVPSLNDEGKLKLYTLAGETVLIQKVKGDELLFIDMSSFASGLYMIEVRSREGFWQKKILKME